MLRTIIEAATWAPNHRNAEPWRFIVLAKGGELREEVAEIVYDWTYDNARSQDAGHRADSANTAKQEILDVPAFVYVYCVDGDNDEGTKENYAAVACAIQNLMLAAQSLGIGVGWVTGRPCKADVGPALGAESNWQIAGALYIGYPSVKLESERAPVDEVTSWR